MSIHGISGPLMPAAPTVTRGGTPAARQHPVPSAPTASSTLAAPAAAGAARANAPAPAPPGTDPALWSVLSDEERAFFAKVGAMGPLTYGRVLSGQMTPPAAALRGGRVDFKV